ncbi:hypothetical protein [Motiliproteus sp. MSK22-1]|uniref:hypothetical protein n=1 Tax=Motiliproteus sp. MSK22-1 TaxID=1897630 RepID=UPI0009761AE6|nr:hypothetical protein [Motiliproteus sp. MSK22-1]OMH26236.1 hypothetical protein BGP75_00980 [Motiliproteus sp. MSK22-1]
MLKLLNCWRARSYPPPLNIEQRVGEYLLELPRCTRNVVVASPRYDGSHYRGEVWADAAQILSWVEMHAKNVWSVGSEHQAARLSLPLWIRGADLENPQPSYLPPYFVDVLDHYVLDLVHRGWTTFWCPDCLEHHQHICIDDCDHQSVGNWSSWTSEWRCPKGHQLYYQEHELYYQEHELHLFT